MIKVGDTVINKVQKSDGGVTTEIPIVQTNDGTLLHLGLNTYKTEFYNSGLQTIITDSYSPFSRRKKPSLNEYSEIGSNFIRTRLYATDTITAENVDDQKTYCDLFGRLEFRGAAYQYGVGEHYSAMDVQLSYGLYDYDSKIKAWASATISWRVGASNVPIATIESSLAGEPGQMELYSKLRGVVAELFINDNMQPCYRVMFIGYDTGGYYRYKDSGIKIASTNAINASNLGTNQKYLQAWIKNGKNQNYIKRNVEIASYKPADFSTYEPNYCLRNMDDTARPLGGSSTDGTLISGRWLPLEDIPVNPNPEM